MPSWKDYLKEFWDIARDFGVDSREVVFEEVPSRVINRLAAQLLPYVPQHWSRGRSFIKQQSSHEQGSRIYEIVFNLDPALAYVAKEYSDSLKSLTVPHVYGHGHIFKNSPFNKKAEKGLDIILRSYSDRVEEYEKEYGPLEVESAIDLALAIVPSSSGRKMKKLILSDLEEKEINEYDHLLTEIFPEEPGSVRIRHKMQASSIKAPKETYLDAIDTDLVSFFIERSLFPDWVNDILRMESTIYEHTHSQETRLAFIHEGFASWTHTKVLSVASVPDEWKVDYAILSSKVTRPFHVYPVHVFGEEVLDIHPNPYGIGLLFMRYLEYLGVDVAKEVLTFSDYGLFSKYSTPDFWFGFARLNAPPPFRPNRNISPILPPTGDHEDFYRIYSYLASLERKDIVYYTGLIIRESYRQGAGWYYHFLVDFAAFCLEEGYDPYSASDLEKAIGSYTNYKLLGRLYEPPDVYAIDMSYGPDFQWIIYKSPPWKSLASSLGRPPEEIEKHNVYVHVLPPSTDNASAVVNIYLYHERQFEVNTNSYLMPYLERYSNPHGARSPSFPEVKMFPLESSSGLPLSGRPTIALTSDTTLDFGYAFEISLLIRRFMNMTKRGYSTDLLLILPNPPASWRRAR